MSITPSRPPGEKSAGITPPPDAGPLPTPPTAPEARRASRRLRLAAVAALVGGAAAFGLFALGWLRPPPPAYRPPEVSAVTPRTAVPVPAVPFTDVSDRPG